MGQTTTSALLSLHYFIFIIGIDTSLNFSSILGNATNDTAVTYSSTETANHIFFIILLFLSLVGLFSFSCCGHVRKKTSTQSGGYLHYGMVTFGFIAVTWYVTAIVQCAATTTCKQKNQKMNARIRLPYLTLLALFFMAEIYFVLTHTKAKFITGWKTKLFLLHLLATNYGIWFRASLIEATERSSKMTNICDKTAIQHYCFGNHLTNNRGAESASTFSKILDYAEAIASPAIVEFCFSASAIVFNMWLFMDKKKQDTEEQETAHRSRSPDGETAHRRSRSPDGETAHRRSRSQEGGTSHGSPDRRTEEDTENRARCPCINQPLVVFFVFLSAAATILVVIYISIAKDKNTLPTKLYVAVQLMIATFCIIYSIIGLFLLKERRGSAVSTHVFIESALLLLSLLGMYIAQVLQLSAILSTTVIHVLPATNTICQEFLTLYSVNSMMYLVLGLFQSLFVISGLQSRNMNRRKTNDRETIRPLKTRMLQLATLSLLIFNVVLWIFATYEMSGIYCNPLFTKFYGRNWTVLSGVFYPLCIFFHFHSAASCWDILKGL